MNRIHQFLFAILGLLVIASTTAAEPSANDAIERAEALESTMNFAEIVRILKPFAESNNPRVEVDLANAYMNLAITGKQPGEISHADIAPAIELAEKAAKHGNGIGLNLLYLIYSNGWGVSADETKAVDYLRRGVEAGDPGAKINYAVALYQGGAAVKQDVDRACKMFLSLLDRDPPDVLAAYYVGLIKLRGQCGKPVDKAGGYDLIEIAANHGVRDAERDMGRKFEFGLTGKTDLSVALKWYTKAADHGEPRSQWRIGMAYLKGEQREKDSAKAVEYFKSAAASDDPNGLTDLAVMYAVGDGVPKDFAKARNLYEKAAKLGNAHAYQELALMYINGEGVAIDPVRARLFYLQAVELGDNEAVALKHLIESKNAVEDMEESDHQFTQWKLQRGAKSK